jgi:hypothetical protein
MSKADTPAFIGPETDLVWQAAPLGTIAETIEQHLILAILGERSGAASTAMSGSARLAWMESDDGG